jgi:hypothetical protein
MPSPNPALRFDGMLPYTFLAHRKITGTDPNRPDSRSFSWIQFRADATSSPAGSGGARDVNVPGNGRGAATNDLFAKAMVIGPACPRQVRCGWCHRTSISHRSSETSMIFSMPLLRTLEFGMSAFTAASAAAP